MTKSGKLGGALLVLACRLAAQTVPPDLPPDLPPATLLLARIKSHMRQELAHLPSYTCLETIARFHREPGAKKIEPLDTIRLEIVLGDHREWYGSPGDKNLSEDHPGHFIGSGMIGDGVFALAVSKIFLSDGPTFQYRGQEDIGGRASARYDFRLPRLTGGVQISIIGGIGTVGEEGSFWADPQSLDLLHLETRAIEIPAFLPLKEMGMEVNYARTRIGPQNLLLAQQGSLHMQTLLGSQDYDHFEFTHCRAYQTQSTLRFDSDTRDSGVSATPPFPGDVIPALLRVNVQLTTPVTERDTLGTLIEGRVSGDVLRKGKIMIPDASVVRGRVRRLEHYAAGGFIVGLEFTDVRVNGESHRFYADLLDIPSIGRKLALRQKVSREVILLQSDESIKITLPELPGVASFFVPGKTFTVPAGFQTVWRTRGLIK
jgi:hypothetical protein